MKQMKIKEKKRRKSKNEEKTKTETLYKGKQKAAVCRRTSAVDNIVP